MRRLFKEIFLLLLLLFFAQERLYAQYEPNSNMAFANTTVNLGTIAEEGGVVATKFDFENVGNRPIIINTISTSCGCTSTTYSREPIMPGATSTITIAYDPMGRPGFFEKKIYVLTENRRSQNILTITGDVTPRPRTISDKYPYGLGGGLLASASYVDFGQVPIGYKHTLSLDLYNNSDKEISVTTARVPDNAELSYYIAQIKLAPKESTQLLVTVNISNSITYELYDEIIPIFIDGKSFPSSSVKVKGVSIPDVSKYNITSESATPAVYLPDVYHHFLAVMDDEKPIKEFTIENEGQGVLKIEKIIVSDKDRISCFIDSAEIPPMSSKKLKVQFKPNGITGRFNGTVMIITNDPSFPLQEINVLANVKESIKK